MKQAANTAMYRIIDFPGNEPAPYDLGADLAAVPGDVFGLRVVPRDRELRPHG
jgi:hypothetical protein